MLLLNPDTVLDQDCISQLLTFALGRPGHGIYGANAVFEDGQPNRLSGLNRPTFRSVLSAALGLRAAFPGSRIFDPEAVWKHLQSTRDDSVQVDIVSGACLLVSRAVWDRLGGFNPRYFMYGEDADLCLRAHQIGCDPVIVRKASLVHAGGGSQVSPAATRMLLLAGRTTLLHQHGSWALRTFATLLHLLHVAVRVAGTTILNLATGSRGKPHVDWRQVWRNRSSWSAGYPAQGSRPPVMNDPDKTE